MVVKLRSLALRKSKSQIYFKSIQLWTFVIYFYLLFFSLHQLPSSLLSIMKQELSLKMQIWLLTITPLIFLYLKCFKVFLSLSRAMQNFITWLQVYGLPLPISAALSCTNQNWLSVFVTRISLHLSFLLFFLLPYTLEHAYTYLQNVLPLSCLDNFHLF